MTHEEMETYDKIWKAARSERDAEILAKVEDALIECDKELSVYLDQPMMFQNVQMGKKQAFRRIKSWLTQSNNP